MAPIAEAFVRLRPDADRFGPDLERQIGGKTDKAGKSLGQRLTTGFGKALKVGGAAAGVGLLAAAGGISRFVSDARESAKVGALSAAVVKSTGGAAHITAKQMGELSTAISNKTGVDDEAIQSAENLIATFTNVRNEVGRGNDIFNRATVAANNMAAALGTEPTQAALQLGKALNDPIKGITALTRSGVSFTAQQKEQIKTLVESGKTLDAQKIILREVGKEFGGAAAAAHDPVDKLKVIVGNLSETIGTALLPYVDKAAGAIGEFVTQMINGQGPGGDFADKARQVGDVIRTQVLPFLRDQLVPALRNDVLPLLAGLGGTIVQTVLPALGQLVQLAGPLLKMFADLPGPVQLAALAFLALGRGAAIAGPQVSGLAGTIKSNFAPGGGGALGVMRGGLTGMMSLLGGPWGIALATAGGVLVHFAAKHAEAKARVDELAHSLDQSTGAITRETRAAVANTLEKSGALEAGRRLGINLRDLTSAALGNAAAQKRVHQTLKDQVADFPTTIDRYGHLTTEQTQTAAAARKVEGAISGSSKEMDAARAKAGRLSEALGGLGDAADQAGFDFGAGLAAGIRKSTGLAVGAAQQLAKQVAHQARATLQEQSPSKVGHGIGVNFSKGIANGIAAGGKEAIAAVGTLVERAVARLAGLKSKASDILSSVGGAVRGVVDISAVGAPVDTGQVDAAGNPITRTPSAAETVAGFAANARAFVDALRAMAAKHIAPALIAAVAAAGPAGGLAAAQSFAAAPPADVASINASIGSIDQLANQAARTVLNTTRIPADIKREQATLDTLNRIEAALKAGGGDVELRVRNGDLFVRWVKAETKKQERRT